MPVRPQPVPAVRRDRALAHRLGVVPRYLPGTAPAELRGPRVADRSFARSLGVVPRTPPVGPRAPEASPVPARPAAAPATAVAPAA